MNYNYNETARPDACATPAILPTGKFLGQGVQAGSIGSNQLPVMEMVLTKLFSLLERAASISQRQGNFLDRLRGCIPQEVEKDRLNNDPVCLMARFDAQLKTLEIILDRFQSHTVAMETLA